MCKVYMTIRLIIFYNTYSKIVIKAVTDNLFIDRRMREIVFTLITDTGKYSKSFKDLELACLIIKKLMFSGQLKGDISFHCPVSGEIKTINQQIIEYQYFGIENYQL